MTVENFYFEDFLWEYEYLTVKKKSGQGSNKLVGPGPDRVSKKTEL